MNFYVWNEEREKFHRQNVLTKNGLQLPYAEYLEKTGASVEFQKEEIPLD